MGVGIAEYEPNGREEVTFAGTIAADDDIVFGGEWLDDRLILVAVVTVELVEPFGHLLVNSVCCTYLLKPWMMICLTYILGTRATR